MYTYLNGQFVLDEDAKISVKDNGFLYGDGIYEALRTYKGKIFRPEVNLKRLMKGLATLKIAVNFSKNDLLKLINEGVQKNGFDETRIRITVTRGLFKKNVTEMVDASLCIQFAELEDLIDEYQNGVRAISFQAERFLPELKTISLASVVNAKIEKEERGVFEVFLINRDGFVTEGSVSNFFIIKDGKIITPGKHILFGTTRELIMEVAGDVIEADLKIEDLYGSDEIFMTNALKGIVPVVELDGRKIGGGLVGEKSKYLMETFNDFIAEF